MIALAPTQPTIRADDLIGHRLTITETVEAGGLHFTGELVGIDHCPNDETYWLLLDDGGVRHSIPWNDIRDIEHHGMVGRRA